jgi:multidrug efflux system outer membrane protein
MKRASTMLALAMLGACTVGPDYQRPEVAVPDAFRYEPESLAPAPDAQWWMRFDDPVLDGYVVEALAHNKNLQIAVANVEQAAGVLTTTDSAFLPQVGYQVNATRQQYSNRSGGVTSRLDANPLNSYQVLAGASWEIDLWGRISRLSESARANLFATDAGRQGVVLSLVATTTNTYIQLLGLDEQLVIAQNTLETYAASVRLFELQHQYGQVSNMTVEQARSQYETAAAQIPALKTQIAQTENALSILLGRNPGPVVRGKKITELVMPSVPPGLPSELLERRPDLIQAEQTLIAANAQIGAARAQYFPSISLTGAFGSASTQLDNLFTASASVWNVGASVTGPIFTGGAISGQVAQAEAGEKAALASYEASIQNAFADVENALVANVNLNDQLSAQERLVHSLSEYSRLARLQYDEGYTSYTTVLQAEQQLFSADLNLASIRAQRYGSLVNIYKALGGGWVETASSYSPQPLDANDSPKPAAQSVSAQ